ncbi:hypothetical protein HK097_009501 [Rhizophlyctis rosea]|uniref:Uncharacterized protein n=1 Tax=Rhizophlyctis rosea TaxID=64517 RepID=A0AAD5X3R9_9FUNG|nr:hypothetical protein HK097_009501 [Rhizophlyctis rosea]
MALDVAHGLSESAFVDVSIPKIGGPNLDLRIDRAMFGHMYTSGRDKMKAFVQELLRGCVIGMEEVNVVRVLGCAGGYFMENLREMFGKAEVEKVQCRGEVCCYGAVTIGSSMERDGSGVSVDFTRGVARQRTALARRREHLARKSAVDEEMRDRKVTQIEKMKERWTELARPVKEIPEAMGFVFKSDVNSALKETRSKLLHSNLLPDVKSCLEERIKDYQKALQALSNADDGLARQLRSSFDHIQNAEKDLEKLQRVVTRWNRRFSVLNDAVKVLDRDREKEIEEDRVLTFHGMTGLRSKVVESGKVLVLGNSVSFQINGITWPEDVEECKENVLDIVKTVGGEGWVGGVKKVAEDPKKLSIHCTSHPNALLLRRVVRDGHLSYCDDIIQEAEPARRFAPFSLANNNRMVQKSLDWYSDLHDRPTSATGFNGLKREYGADWKRGGFGVDEAAVYRETRALMSDWGRRKRYRKTGFLTPVTNDDWENLSRKEDFWKWLIVLIRDVVRTSSPTLPPPTKITGYKAGLTGELTRRGVTRNEGWARKAADPKAFTDFDDPGDREKAVLFLEECKRADRGFRQVHPTQSVSDIDC